MRIFVSIVVALLGLYSSGSAQSIDYKNKAKELYASIQNGFYIQDSGYYRENAKGIKSENSVSYLWSLCAMIQASNEMDVVFKKGNYFEKTLAVVEKYKDDSAPTTGYASYKLGNKTDDRYYDDNQWIGIAALDAYRRTKNKSYLKLGETIYHFMMSGYDTISGGGIYWVEPKKTSKNTCSNGPGILVALGMYQVTKEKKYLDTAILLYDWTNKHLRAANGLYFDNLNLEKHKVDSTYFSYNAGTMLESAAWLYQISKDEKYLNDATTTAKSSAAYFLKDGKFKDDYWFSAVLLRGYLRLLKIDKDKSYINQFQTALNNAIIHEHLNNGLYGKIKTENLVWQGGMLEMLCRFAEL